MIVRSFLAWAGTAPAAARAEGAAALARAFLADELDPADRHDAEVALTALLDDGSPLVRMALARELGGDAAAPHHLLTTLLADRPDIAAVILRASPRLGEDELIEAVALGDAVTQAAVARRPYLSAAVAGAIAEIGTLAGCHALCANATATLAPWSATRLIERFGHDAVLRDLLSRRDDLESGARHDLAMATGRALTEFAAACGWLPRERAERVTREAGEETALALAVDAIRHDGAAGLSSLVQHLLGQGRLTPALLLRAVLSGQQALFEAALGTLAGMPPARVAGLVRGAPSLGFSALYDRAGLPAALRPVFEVAVREAARSGDDARDTSRPVLRRSLVGKVLAACAGEGGKVGALLRGFEAQAAREDARRRADAMVKPMSPPGAPAMRLLPNAA